MKKVWKPAAFGAVILLIAVGAVLGVRFKKQEHLRFAARLGNGFNLGNALDATNLWETTPNAPELSYETYWGNPSIDDTQLAAIRAAGFSSVRIPVTWEDHIDENGVISQTWMDRVAEVVDMALAEELYVILDTHHEDWLNMDTEHEAEINERYKTVWAQIAQRFADRDNHLIFEGMNEPRLRGSEHEWDAGTPELRAMVNRLNRTFVETVRETGGENRNRYLMISAYATGTETEALDDLEVPDGNIIVSVHMYQPYSFCQDREGTAEWNPENAGDTEKIAETFAELYTRFIEQGTPVALTEFGCVDKENDDARAAWVSFYREHADSIPCFWWDNGSSYQLLDRESGKWRHPEILDVLVQVK